MPKDSEKTEPNDHLSDRIPPQAPTQPDTLAAFITRYSYQRGFRTSAELAKEAGIAPSTLSAILAEKVRRPSAKVLARIARVLCPPEAAPAEFANEMLKCAGRERATTREQAIEGFRLIDISVAQRVEQTRKLRVGLVNNFPFSHRKQTKKGWVEAGLAVELVRYIARIMRAEPVFVPPPSEGIYDFKDLPKIFIDNKVDIVASGVIPTFERRRNMDFSRNIPYLYIPLTAIARADIQPPISVREILSWSDSTSNPRLSQLRWLFVEGEAGHDFADAFLQGLPFGDDRTQCASSLDPKALYDLLTRTIDPYDIFVADSATCSNILAYDTHGQLTALSDDIREDPSAPETIRGTKNLPLLAHCQIALALPPKQPEWKQRVDQAMNSLYAEGLRAALTIYHIHTAPPNGTLFHAFSTRHQDISDRYIHNHFRELWRRVNKAHDERNKKNEDERNRLASQRGDSAQTTNGAKTI